MSDPATNPPQSPGPIQLNVNLEALQSRYFVRLQHLLDMLAVSMKSAEVIDSGTAMETSSFLNVAPAQNRRLSPRSASTEAVAWHIRNAFRDAMEATTLFLEECRAVAAIIKAAASHSLTWGRLQEIHGPEAAAYHRANLPDKLSALKQDFGVDFALALHVRTINAVRNCLVHRRGVVGTEDIGPEGTLVLQWQVLEVFAEDPTSGSEKVLTKADGLVNAGWPVFVRFADKSRVFAVSESIDLTYDEIMHTLTTLMNFGAALVQALREQVAASRPPMGPR